jgi:hypothetical protein
MLLTSSSPVSAIVPAEALTTEQYDTPAVAYTDEIAGFAIEDDTDEVAAFADAVPASIRQMRNITATIFIESNTMGIILSFSKWIRSRLSSF